MVLRAKVILSWAFFTSVGLHGVAYASLAGARAEAARSVPVSEVTFEVQPKAVPLPEPTQEPKAPEPVAVSTAPTTVNRTAAPAPLAAPPPSTPAAPVATAPLDLSGVTLTNDSGTGFAMPVGDGSARRGPIVGGRAAVALREAPAAPKPMSGRALVPAADLSEHPRPPSLEGLLRANYPAEAKQRGLRGSARVRARIDADGLIRSVQQLSESTPGFGAACRRTVQGSRWSAPRDKNGGAVATEIVYTCHFEVGQ